MELEINNKKLEKFTNVEIKQYTPKSPMVQRRDHKENYRVLRWTKKYNIPNFIEHYQCLEGNM